MQRILKTIKLNSANLKMDDADKGKFTGYASVFGGIDSYGDTIMAGAFVETLVKNGLPKMFFNHEWDMPIGKYTLAEEDQTGLLVSGEYTPDLGLAEDVYAAMRHGTIDGLSIGGYLAVGDYEETATGRIIHRWTNLVEISPVVFPADSAARVGDVKGINYEALLADCKTERDIERLLRDAGLGKWEAMATVSCVKAIVEGRDAQDDANTKALDAVLERIKRIAG